MCRTQESCSRKNGMLSHGSHGRESGCERTTKAHVAIFHDDRNVLTDKLHLVCALILQITKMGCCGNCRVRFSLLKEK